jgi:hypothetical protein
MGRRPGKERQIQQIPIAFRINQSLPSHLLLGSFEIHLVRVEIHSAGWVVEAVSDEKLESAFVGCSRPRITKRQVVPDHLLPKVVHCSVVPSERIQDVFFLAPSQLMIAILSLSTN